MLITPENFIPITLVNNFLLIETWKSKSLPLIPLNNVNLQVDFSKKNDNPQAFNHDEILSNSALNL